MNNSFCFSSRTEQLVRTTKRLTHLRAPAAQAVRIVAALSTPNASSIQSLELDFSAHDPVDDYKALIPLLETTATLRRIQLFGARGQTTVTHLHSLLEAVQRNPHQPQLELVCCRLLPRDFAVLPAHCSLRGVRLFLVDPDANDHNEEVTTALQSNKHLISVRLTAYLGLPLLLQVLRNLPSTVQHVAVYHHGCCRDLLRVLASLSQTIPHIQVEYMQFRSDEVWRMFMGNDGAPQQEERRITLTSCTFAPAEVDPWPLLQGSTVAFQGLCPILPPNKLTVRHLDVSKVVIDRSERIHQVLLALSANAATTTTSSALESLVLGDVSPTQLALLMDKLPKYRTLKRLEFCPTPGHADDAILESHQLRQAFRHNASVTDCTIHETEESKFLTRADATAIQWYTSQRNRRLVSAMHQKNGGLFVSSASMSYEHHYLLLPRFYQLALEAQPTPTEVCRNIMERLPR